MAEGFTGAFRSCPATVSRSVWPSDTLAKPIHIQRVEEALRLEPLLAYIEALNKQPVYSCDDNETKDGVVDAECLRHSKVKIENSKVTLENSEISCMKKVDGNWIYNGTTVISKAERRSDKSHLYNFGRVKKSRKWIKSVLLSDTSSDDDDDTSPITDADLTEMLKLHLYQKKCRRQFAKEKELRQYQYYSVGLLSNVDKFYEHQRTVVGPRKKMMKEKLKKKKVPTEQKLQKLLDSTCELPSHDIKEECTYDNDMHEGISQQLLAGSTMMKASMNNVKTKSKKLTEDQINARRKRLFVMIAKKEIPRAQKQKAALRKEMLANVKKIARESQKEARKLALISQKASKEATTKVRRLSKEMQVYWKRFDKVEKEHRRKAEREALEQRKIDVEFREMKRQQRKLNFLITQTELYAHFMARKLTGGTTADRDNILGRLDENKSAKRQLADGRVAGALADDDYDSNEVKSVVLNNAHEAYKAHQHKNRVFDAELKGSRKNDDVYGESVFANPSISSDVERCQPTMFEGELKSYQLKGMNWLANLYDQGINGILADEMGLGKTVQSIALFAHLAESLSIWGPFLVIAPASTLHNWQQEITKFVPKFKVVPYWGNTQDRKILRKFWNQDSMHTEESSFHIVVTSYQLVVTDVKYFQRVKWHYMILDEAQAIKSSTSARWKVLLGFNCRNRLLLSGTPIQNSMAELWALLHFIMPTLFDSHDEFNEWFSKDIESHASSERQSNLDENQLGRLHMILKPFMLRRVKKDVENELSDKIEILMYCPLTQQQRVLYQAIKYKVKDKISIEDLVQSTTAGSSRSTNNSLSLTSTSSLMNLVMQFRKVCNHPELFERRDIRSPFYMRLEPYHIPKLVYREGVLSNVVPSKRHLLYDKFYIYNSDNVSHSLFPQDNSTEPRSSFSFTRFIDMSPNDLQMSMLSGLCARWMSLVHWMQRSHRTHQQHEFVIEPISTRYLNRYSLDLSVDSVMSPANLRSSPNLRDLVFTSPSSCVYAHTDHTLHRIKGDSSLHKRRRILRACANSQSEVASNNELLMSRSPKLLPCMPTEMPEFLYYSMPKVRASLKYSYVSDRSAAWHHALDSIGGGSVSDRSCLLYGSPDGHQPSCHERQFFFPPPAAGLAAIQPKHGFSCVNIPDKETLVTDAGKLYVLDQLLTRLKAEDHRVLIYSQMTKMIDILEEYLWHRKLTYIRLDGSSKISDRRDMVADFQARSDIFVFLLSTRAGGLGINLTAADTVIFYDSDWNPTVDQQAMDRAHRLGQTKQVTVYRLICKGTIEERILQRAKEKSEIQRMVISGSNFMPDILKPKEVVSLLLDDDEMERKLTQKQDEKKIKDEVHKEKDRARKRKPVADKSPRGPGRPPSKVSRLDDIRGTTVADDSASVSLSTFRDDSSVMSCSSALTPRSTSPYSEISVVSEFTRCQSESIADDDNDGGSDEGLIIVDNISRTASPASGTTTTVKSGRPRGRPKAMGGTPAAAGIAATKSPVRGNVRKSRSVAAGSATVENSLIVFSEVEGSAVAVVGSIHGTRLPRSNSTTKVRSGHGVAKVNKFS